MFSYQQLLLLVAVTVALPYPEDAAAPAEVVAPVDAGPAPGDEKVDERFFLRPSYGGHGHGHGHGHHAGGHGGYGNNYNSKSSPQLQLLWNILFWF